MSDKEKSTGILCGSRAFLTQYGANKRCFQALLPYGALPNRQHEFLWICPGKQVVFDNFCQFVQFLFGGIPADRNPERTVDDLWI